MSDLMQQFEDALGDRIGGGIEVVLPIQLEDMVTPKYLYLTLDKVWMNARVRTGVNDGNSGTTLSLPPAGNVLLAITRPGKEDVEEELKEGSMPIEEFYTLIEAHMRTMASLSVIHKEDVTEKGF